MPRAEVDATPVFALANPAQRESTPSGVAEYPREVEGKVLNVELDPPRFLVQIDGQSSTFAVDKETAEIFGVGCVVRGGRQPSQEKGGMPRLEDVWPNSLELRETLARGVSSLKQALANKSGAVVEGAVFPLQAFVDERARWVSPDRFRGKHLLVNFVYGRCADPQMCPAVVSRMGTVRERLPEELRSRLEIVFVTLDPDFDTPSRCLGYLRAHGLERPGFSMLTGPRDAVESLYRLCGLRMERLGEGLLQHTQVTFWIGPDGNLQRTYPGSNVSAETLVRDLSAGIAGPR